MRTVLFLFLALPLVFAGYSGIEPECGNARQINITSVTRWYDGTATLGCNVSLAIAKGNLTLSNFTLLFSSNTTEHIGIVGNCSELYITNNSNISSVGDNGTFILLPHEGYTMGSNCRVRIENSKFDKLGIHGVTDLTDGIKIRSCQENSYIHGNIFTNCYDAVGVVTGSGSSIACVVNVSSNYIKNVKYNAFDSTGPGALNFQWNNITCLNSATSPVLLSSTTNHRIWYNDIGPGAGSCGNAIGLTTDKKASIKGNMIHGLSTGITSTTNPWNISVTYNTFEDLTSDGIKFNIGIKYWNITDNIFSNTSDGIEAYNASGLAGFVNISRNFFLDTRANALHLYRSGNFTISHNNFTDITGMGIRFEGTDLNITYNNFTRITNWTIKILSTAGIHYVHHNNFYDRTIFANTTNGGWHLANKGNYWSNHTTPDTDCNTIVDNSYTLTPSGKLDEYPQTYPIGGSAPSCGTCNVSRYGFCGGNYTGIAPNCTSTNVTINVPTHWWDIKANLSCSFIIRANFTIGNATINMTDSGAVHHGFHATSGTTGVNVIIQNSTISGGNMTFFTSEFSTYDMSDAVEWDIANNYFRGLGDWTDVTGNPTPSIYNGFSFWNCGRGTKFYNNTFDNVIKAIHLDARSNIGACEANITYNNFSSIHRYSITTLNGKYMAFIIGNNTHTGDWRPAAGMYTTTGQFHYSSNTNGTRISHNDISGHYYSTNFVNGDDYMVVHNNYIHNGGMGDDLNINVTYGRYYNETYANIEQIGIYVYGASHHNTFDHITMVNVTPDPSHPTTNGNCIWIASRDPVANPYGNAHNNTFRNISCTTARICAALSDSAGNSFSGISCLNITDDGFEMTSPTTATHPYAVTITKSNFTNIGVYSIHAETGSNLTFYWNNFYDQNVSIESTDVRAWNYLNSSGNYWSNDTVPDANSDGIVDHPHILPGNGSRLDLYPLADPFTVPTYLGAGVPPTTGPYHVVYFNITNGTTRNISKMDNYTAAVIYSNNETWQWLTFYVNGTLHTKVNASNATYYSFNSSGMGAGAYVFRANTSYNSTGTFLITITNISGVPAPAPANVTTSPYVLAICDQMYTNMNLLAVVLIIFVGISAIGALMAFNFNPVAVVVAVTAGLVASTVGVTILISLC